MKSLTRFTGNEIVGFHVGRGGRFYNPGHITFLGEHRISDFTEHCYAPTKLVLLEDGTEVLVDDESPLAEWTDENGSSVGLTNEKYKSGIGCIDHDGEYDTTYTMYLKDIECDSQEWESIINSTDIDAEDALIFLYNQTKYTPSEQGKKYVLEAIHSLDPDAEYEITEALTDGNVILFLFEEKDYGCVRSSAIMHMDSDEVLFLDDWDGSRPENIWEIEKYKWY